MKKKSGNSGRKTAVLGKVTLRTWLSKNRKFLLTVGICVLLAAVFVLLRSWSTSILYPDYLSYGGDKDSGDSLQFMTMGKMWLAGKIPYIQFFDHKGPWVFFCDMLGFWIGGGARYGIMILQIIALAITFYYVLKLGRLVSENKLWSWMILAMTMIYIAVSYASGNSVQEWNLPFIAVAVYYMVEFFYRDKTSQREHSPKYALIYGITIGACFLAQATHAILICAGVLVIFVMLVLEKNWKNLRQNLLYGLAGLIGILLPFVIYFAVVGALGEFFYYTFIYNMFYTANIGSWLKGATANDVMMFAMVFFPFFCAFLTAILAWMRGKKPYAITLIIAGVLEGYLFLSAQAFHHYVLPFVFQLPLFLNEVYLMRQDDEAWRLLRMWIVTLFLILTYNLTTSQLSLMVAVYNDVRASKIEGIGYEALVKRHENELKTEGLTVYGANQLKGAYLMYDILPHNRFFIIQAWHASMNQDLAAEIYEDFTENQPEYLLLDKYYLENPYNINEILKKDYKEIDKDGIYHLYQLK